MFTCIYCRESTPKVVPSEAHIFPDAMGGVTSTKDAVCVDCNGKIEKAFEEIEIRKFSFFRSIWGIRNRRGNIAGVPAVVDFANREFKVLLDETGQHRTAIVAVENCEDGNKIYNVVGPSAKVEEKRKEIDNRKSALQWREMDLTATSPPKSQVVFDTNLTRLTLRRLAAKVAFERWAQIRGSLVACDQQFDVIRGFIIEGNEQELCSGVLGDSRLLNDILRFPTGNHAVAILAHPRNRTLGAFVAFYSLFYFWVILSSKYQALAPFDDLLLENPQNEKVSNPILRSGVGNLFVNWQDIEKVYRSNPDKVVQSAKQHGFNKFQAAADTFYDSKEKTKVNEKT